MSNSTLDDVAPRADVLVEAPLPPALDRPEIEPARLAQLDTLPRPAWLEIDLRRLTRNFQLIQRELPSGTELLAVIKDEAYGHGAYRVARVALECGARFLALSTLEEAVTLHDRGIRARLLLLGDRHESELLWCISHDLTCCVSEAQTVHKLGQLAARANKRVPVHLKINTGLNRYGVHWKEATALAALIASTESLELEGVLSHFAQSDEEDRSFALRQLACFEEALRGIAGLGIRVPIRHLCNTGGFLDLPQAHFDMVRLGLLPLGVYPSAACRRLPGLEPVLSVKARIAAIQNLQPGDSVGYGMRFKTTTPRRIAVLPIGYGDGFPRVRNQGCVLIQGQRAPVVGSVAMDAVTVDITEIPQAELWDEAVLMGRQGDDEISVHEIARLKNSVSYDMLAGWRARLPRLYVNQTTPR